MRVHSLKSLFVLLAVSAAALAPVSLAGNGPKFYPDDPIAREPESQDASGAQPWDITLMSDLLIALFVKPGDRVRTGDPLLQINADKQQATVRSTEANRAGTEADVEYWREHVKRLEALVAAGAISKQEFEQARTSLRTWRDMRASLIQPGGPDGPSFLIYNNYRVLLRWNRSLYFAAAVGFLADRIDAS